MKVDIDSRARVLGNGWRILGFVPLAALIGCGGLDGGAAANRGAVEAEIASPPQPSSVHVCAQPRAGFAACHALVRANAQGTVTAAATPSGLAPTDLASAYNLNTGLGTGATIAIVDAQDNPNAESSLAVYRSTFGLPACTTANGCFKKVNESGAASPLPSGDSGWGLEISLDLDMASAVCPNCKILLVEATSASVSDLGTAVNTAVRLGATVVSNSYGGAESSSDSTYDTQYYHHTGVGIFVSSGDGGYGVEYPAASQYVTAVGGTTLARSTTAARGWVESAWSGAGSGCSAYETKPSWQRDTGCAKRAVADVSAVADPDSGVAVYDSYGQNGWVVVGGTSAASPIVAGIYALTAHGGDPALSYSSPYAFYDVTTGSNGSCGGSYLCTARAGYDGPTGNGSPNGRALAALHHRGSDFNGDGEADLMIVTSSGSYEYLAIGNGQFKSDVNVRNDLPLGKVQYTPGDFNGDGKTDLMIVTASGSYEYLATGNGQFQSNVNVRTDLPLGAVQYTAGDFNGDGKTDLMIVTASGSYEYLAIGNGQFQSDVNVRTDLPLGAVQYTPGDFNGDGMTDLMIVTASGSYEYLSIGNGQFKSDVNVRTDLPLGKVAYTTADFNGDAKTDLMIATASGSYEYLATGNGQFQSNVNVRTDLPLGAVGYLPADFNGDGKTDLMIDTASGSYEYLATGNGQFQSNVYVRSDLPLGAVLYY